MQDVVRFEPWFYRYMPPRVISIAATHIGYSAGSCKETAADTLPRWDTRRESKKYAEFNANAMTLNVFRKEKRSARCVAIFLSSNMVYENVPENMNKVLSRWIKKLELEELGLWSR